MYTHTEYIYTQIYIYHIYIYVYVCIYIFSGDAQLSHEIWGPRTGHGRRTRALTARCDLLGLVRLVCELIEISSIRNANAWQKLAANRTSVWNEDGGATGQLTTLQQNQFGRGNELRKKMKKSTITTDWRMVIPPKGFWWHMKASRIDNTRKDFWHVGSIAADVRPWPCPSAAVGRWSFLKVMLSRKWYFCPFPSSSDEKRNF